MSFCLFFIKSIPSEIFVLLRWRCLGLNCLNLTVQNT
jgi:hypothetical protein